MHELRPIPDHRAPGRSQMRQNGLVIRHGHVTHPPRIGLSAEIAAENRDAGNCRTSWVKRNANFADNTFDTVEQRKKKRKPRASMALGNRTYLGFTRAEWQRFPWQLLAVVALLTAMSLVCIASASYRPVTDSEWANDGYHFRQLQWLCVSAVLGLAALSVPYRRLSRGAWLYYLVGILLLILVMTMGRTVNGAKRWLDLKFMLLQPSELVKLAVIVMLAHYLRDGRSLQKITGLIWPGLIVAVPAFFILRQPDLGTTLVLGPIYLVMMFVAGARTRDLAVLVIVALIVAVVYVMFLIKPYQQDRLVAFLDPEKYARAEGYHLVQSKTAIGAGGVLGNGFRHGTQNSLGYLPENHTDFIFAVVGEEWGFVGSATVIALFAVMLVQIFMIAYDCRDPFGRLFCTGVGTLYGFQIFVNIGMTIGLMPITGLTLPFFSYGGSSLMVSSLAIGLVINIRMRQVCKF